MNNIWQPLCDNVTTDFDILYCRLSRDDGPDDKDSDSIANQRAMLTDFAAKNGFDHPVCVVDDGFTGTNFNRPGWQLIVQELDAGNVRSIICKNKDRMGRDYLRMGLYMEMFRERDIRFIAIGDNVDNIREDDDFAPFRDIFAEYYARDTSRKIKAVLHAKGNSGKALNNHTVYGYRKDPDDPNHLLIDETAAPTVRRIFQMTIDGMGPYQIARKFTDEGLIRPSCHIARIDGRATEKTEENAHHWRYGTVRNIVSRAEYMGHTINFRTYRPSYKSGKVKKNPPEKWVIFENTHEAIISPEEWETAQKCRTVRRRPNKKGDTNPLTGLVYCEACGNRLYNHKTKSNPSATEQDFYMCTRYNSYPPRCTPHRISVRSLRELILTSIRNVSGYVTEREAEFVEKMRENSDIQLEVQAKSQKKQLAADKHRVSELDGLIQKIYEDKVKGTLSEKRFVVLSVQYESEQELLEARIAESERELAEFTEDSTKANKFIALVRKYTNFEELTPAMLHEFIDKVVVHEAERPRGQRNQRVDIYLTYIGQFVPPGCEQTFPEIQSPEEKQRQYRRDYYWRHRERILETAAIRNEKKKLAKTPKPEKSAEEIEAEQRASAEQIERRKEYQREYQRERRKRLKDEAEARKAEEAGPAA